MSLYLTSSGKIAVQSGKPALITDENFFDCCCWDCGSTITVQVCCGAGVYAAFNGRYTLPLETSSGIPYYYFKQLVVSGGGGSIYQWVVVKDSTLGWVLVLRIVTYLGQSLAVSGSWPYNVPYIRLRAASGFADDCPPSGSWSRHACAEATSPAPPNNSTCACSINTDIMAFMDMASQTCVCTEPTLAISSTAFPEVDQGVAKDYTFTVSDPNNFELHFTVDWGDGTSSTATATGCNNYVTISKTYSHPGEFTITGTARVTSGGTVVATNTREIQVDRAFSFDDCDEWYAASAGNQGNFDDSWTLPDVATVPVGTPIDLRFDAYSIPDKFMVDYDGDEVYNSGWRGSSSYEGDPLYPGGIAGPGQGQENGVFTRITGVNTFKVRVEAPQSGTAWEYDIRANCSDLE